MDGQSGSKKAEGKNKRRRWRVVGAGGVVLLLIAGAVLWRAQAGGWDFSWAALTGKPVAMVNGEEISRASFRACLRVSRGMRARQYGKGIFAGEQGRTVLAELEADVLERLIRQRLIGQEARRLNISVTQAQVDREIEAIGREVYGSPEKLQASLKEEGISAEYLSSHIRSLLLGKEVDKAKLAATAERGAPLGYWLAKARQEAKVDLYQTVGLVRAAGAGGSCCGPGGAAGGSGSDAAGKGPVADPKNEAAAAGLAAYGKANPAAREVQAKVTDYGCHMQVDIEQAGKRVKSYLYQNGEVTAL
jgi:hypothetical protein